MDQKTKSIKWLLFSLLFLFASLHASLEKIYVQASVGSFNHQALQELLGESINEYTIQFCGTPENTVREASRHHGLAFCALHNTTIPGNFVPPTLSALQTHRIERLFKSYSLKVEMALILHQEGSLEGITHLASHPAALQQITLWKERHPPLIEIPIPEGTAEAARRLSAGELTLNSAVVGPKSLVSLYPNLYVAAEAIQDSEDNYTTFILFEPAEREAPATPTHVLDEVTSIQVKKMGSKMGSGLHLAI